jgi:hypothetical protein
MISLALEDLKGEPSSIHCLCLIGLKSWTALDWKNQEYWEMSAGKLKGVDCRSDLEQCTSIGRGALSELMMRRLAKLKVGKNYGKVYVQGGRRDSHQMAVQPAYPDAFVRAQEILFKDLARHPIPKTEIEAAVAERAIEAHRANDWIFSISPDLARARAIELLTRAYMEEQDLRSKPSNRGRWRDWLPLIEEFERDASAWHGVKSKLFARYRRAMDGFNFA